MDDANDRLNICFFFKCKLLLRIVFNFSITIFFLAASFPLTHNLRTNFNFSTHDELFCGAAVLIGIGRMPFSFISADGRRIRSVRYRVQWRINGCIYQQVVDASEPIENFISATRHAEIP